MDLYTAESTIPPIGANKRFINQCHIIKKTPECTMIENNLYELMNSQVIIQFPWDLIQ